MPSALQSTLIMMKTAMDVQPIDIPKEISDTFEVYGFCWSGHYPLIGSYINPMHFEYMKDLCEGI